MQCGTGVILRNCFVPVDLSLSDPSAFKSFKNASKSGIDVIYCPCKDSIHTRFSATAHDLCESCRAYGTEEKRMNMFKPLLVSCWFPKFSANHKLDSYWASNVSWSGWKPWECFNDSRVLSWCESQSYPNVFKDHKLVIPQSLKKMRRPRGIFLLFEVDWSRLIDF